MICNVCLIVFNLTMPCVPYLGSLVVSNGDQLGTLSRKGMNAGLSGGSQMGWEDWGSGLRNGGDGLLGIWGQEVRPLGALSTCCASPSTWLGDRVGQPHQHGVYDARGGPGARLLEEHGMVFPEKGNARFSNPNCPLPYIPGAGTEARRG